MKEKHLFKNKEVIKPQCKTEPTVGKCAISLE